MQKSKVFRTLSILVVAAIFSRSVALGDQVRYYLENGITYCETRRTVQRPVCETTMKQTTQTVYKEQYYTETKDVSRVSWCPVTVYQANTYLAGEWNPFVQPHYETQWVPQTVWQQRTEVVKMPVTCRKLTPESQQVQMPVTTRKMVSEDVVVSRVAVSGPGIYAAPQNVAAAQPRVGYSGSIYNGVQIGGIARLNQDPPRHGVNAPGSTLSPR